MSYWVRHDPERGTLEPGASGGTWPGPSQRARTLRRGLLTFLLPLASLFGLVIMAYVLRRHLPDWQAIPLPWQVWLSTLLLLGSSVTFEQARQSAEAAHWHDVRRRLLGSGALAVAFIGSQLWAWYALYADGYVLGANPANSFFYLMTGLHALHLVAGLVAWSKTRAALLQQPEPATTATTYVQLCAIYWHFLLLVWLVLFAVLLVAG